MDILWDLEPHTRAKHIVLEEYLKAWFGIMGQTFDRILYVDGFAGPGMYRTGEDGSPLIALRTVSGHRLLDKFKEVRMFFIESDQDKAGFLKQLCEQRYPPDQMRQKNIYYDVVNATFCDVLTEVLNRLEARGRNLAPSFVFIDPFGISIPMEVIGRILKYPHCEVLINFMYDAINRWGGVHEQHLDSLFGCEEWRHAWSFDPDKRKEFLTGLYLEQLRKEARARYVRSLEVKDRNNRTKYFLFFATNRIEGLREMKNAMWKVDPRGLFRFSAFERLRHAGQISLLDGDEIHCNELAKILADNFCGQKALIEAVERFVIAETSYLQKHLRPALQLLEQSVPPAISVDRPGKKGFPPGTWIYFNSR